MDETDQQLGLGGLLLFGMLLALANLLGGLLIISFREGRWRDIALKYLIALGAGFMLAAIFIEIVPESFNLWTENVLIKEGVDNLVGPMTLLLMGYLLIHLFEHTVAPHFHFGAETHPESVLSPKAAYTALGGLTIHTFFDGVSIAAAASISFTFGLLIFIAIMLHKVPEGFTAASIILSSGRSKRKALMATIVIGLTTLAGVICVALLKDKATGIVSYALPFSAGVTLYVAASDLIPEVNHVDRKNPRVSLAVFGGVAFFYILHLMFER
jgi:zinc transporter ZupT